MTDKSSPEWQAFATEVMDAVHADRLSMDSVWVLDHAPSLTAARQSFVLMKQEYGEFRLLRDVWQQERASRNRWWITLGIGVLAVVIVAVALHFS